MASAHRCAPQVPVVPGTDSAVRTEAEAEAFVKENGLPVIIKAAMGGGGKGMRVVREQEDLIPFFQSATSEAEASFGDGSVFIERFVSRPRHIEIQVIGDGKGGAVHLWERDCSVQRRYQKVVEIAPAWNLSPELRKNLQARAAPPPLSPLHARFLTPPHPRPSPPPPPPPCPLSPPPPAWPAAERRAQAGQGRQVPQRGHR
jgi:acetyl/propionyl-CoA carboxylase alpha subunit